MSDDINKNVDQDYEFSRDVYYDLIEKGRESLELMIEVARESEHPRAFEVLGGMIKGVSDVNGKLMELNKKDKEIRTAQLPSPSSPIGSTVNNLFVGTTSELQKFVQDQQKALRDEKVIEQHESDSDD